MQVLEQKNVHVMVQEWKATAVAAAASVPCTLYICMSWMAATFRLVELLHGIAHFKSFQEEGRRWEPGVFDRVGFQNLLGGRRRGLLLQLRRCCFLLLSPLAAPTIFRPVLR